MEQRRLEDALSGREQRLPSAGGSAGSNGSAADVRELRGIELRKEAFAEGFPVFVERVNRAGRPHEVHEAVVEHVPRLLGVFRALLFLPAVGSPEPGSRSCLRLWGDAELSEQLGDIPSPADDLPEIPTIVRAEDAGVHAGGSLRTLFTDHGIRALTEVDLEGHGVLVLLERRQSRSSTGEDWFRLRTLAHHVCCSLERIQLKSEMDMERSAPAESHATALRNEPRVPRQ